MPTLCHLVNTERKDNNMTIPRIVVDNAKAESKQQLNKAFADALHIAEVSVSVARAARIVALLDVMNKLEGNELALDVVNDMLIDSSR